MAATVATYLRVPSKAHSDVDRLNDWLNVATYRVRLADVTDALDTGENILAYIPEDVYLVGLAYQCTAPFFNDSDELCQPSILIGDTTNTSRFGKFTGAQMMSTDCRGEIALNFGSTASYNLALDIGYGVDSGPDTGTLELWLSFRPKIGLYAPAQGVFAR